MNSSNSSSFLSVMIQLPFIKLILALSLASNAFGCYTSIFNFGDSLSDTGNLYSRCISNEPPNFCFSPYGETFFRRPTGRSSDGRLILDFIAESLGIPLLRPYLDRERINVEDFGKGLNFAVSGATALDELFLQEKGISVPFGNYTLMVQLEWFKKTFSSICRISRCREILGSSLILMGEIGGNDYNYPFFAGHSFEEIKSLVPLVVKTIASAITELIEMGAKTLMVPGNLPIGCSGMYLKIYKTSEKEQYHPENGCLNWLNEFSEYHNEQLQMELDRIRASHPSVDIIYADYYNAAMRFYNAPQDFGFTNTLQACCVGGGGSFNASTKCGSPLSSLCAEPSKYVSWDGVHLTEAAYRAIATALLHGPYTTPRFKTVCDIPQNGATTAHFALL